MNTHDRSSGSKSAQGGPPRLLTVSDVICRTGLSRSSLRRLEDAGEFPQRVKLGARRVAWLEQEVNLWITWRCAEGRK